MSLTKAVITNVDSHAKIQCLFNPSEYTIAKSNSWQPKPVIGKNVPKLDFTGGGSRTMTIELFFDVYEHSGKDVRDHVKKLWDLTMIDEGKKNAATKRSRPPLCIFQWGGNWAFTAAVTSLSVRYTLFRQDGTPVRAVASVTLMEAKDEKDYAKQNPTSHSEAGYKSRTVRPSDTLAMISYEEYGDSNHWRKIADANGLDNPLAISAGQRLAIPPL